MNQKELNQVKKPNYYYGLEHQNFKINTTATLKSNHYELYMTDAIEQFIRFSLPNSMDSTIDEVPSKDNFSEYTHEEVKEPDHYNSMIFHFYLLLLFKILTFENKNLRSMKLILTSFEVIGVWKKFNHICWNRVQIFVILLPYNAAYSNAVR
uniref:Uncharacterized protein n=1 Tax=Rhizophagus irregularis (strain DAOM 181602 / DAOM 197198 / MUCL 43194) TaxID=747089 RepID=U9TZV2_RHIID